MTFISLLISFLLISTSTFASSFNSFKKEFDQSHKISDASQLNGWFSGRCFTSKFPKKEKSGISVFIPTEQQENKLPFKFQIPAGSMGVGKPDYYDQYDAEVIENLKEVIFAENNKPAFYQNNDISTYLYYDNSSFPILKAFLRQIDNSLTVKIINADTQDETKEIPFGFCKFSKRISNWEN